MAHDFDVDATMEFLCRFVIISSLGVRHLAISTSPVRLMQPPPVRFAWPPLATLQHGPATEAERAELTALERELAADPNMPRDGKIDLLFRAATRGSKVAMMQLCALLPGSHRCRQYWARVAGGNHEVDHAYEYARALGRKLETITVRDGYVDDTTVRSDRSRAPLTHAARRDATIPRGVALLHPTGTPGRPSALEIHRVRASGRMRCVCV